MNKPLTATERVVLESLKATHMHRTTAPSIVGYAIWDKADPATRKRNPSPQGMALLASKHLRTLDDAKLVRWVPSPCRGWFITAAGKKALEDEAAKT